MIREIMHEEAFLKQPSVPATKEDVNIAQDLIETHAAHK